MSGHRDGLGEHQAVGKQHGTPVPRREEGVEQALAHDGALVPGDPDDLPGAEGTAVDHDEPGDQVGGPLLGSERDGESREQQAAPRV